MGQWTFDPAIAGVIVNGRVRGTASLRATAEASLGPLSDKLWEQLEPKWRWHETMSTDELQRSLIAPPPLPDPG